MRAFVLLVSASILGLTVASSSFAQNFSGFISSADLAHAKMLQESYTYLQIHHMKVKATELAAEVVTCHTGADCVQFGMGSRTCGGPTNFIVTSNTNPKLAELQQLVEDVTTTEAAANKQFGHVGTCMVETAPTFNCVQNACQIMPAAR